MSKNYFTDGQLNAIHKEICRLEDLESGTSLPVHPLNNVETANLRRICNLAVKAAIGEPFSYFKSVEGKKRNEWPTKDWMFTVTTCTDEIYDTPLYSVKELES